jgi:AraC-like DNA-binding protein
MRRILKPGKDALVSLLRWQSAEGKCTSNQSHPQNWIHLEKAVRYLHQHYAESLYVDQIATAVGITANALRELFGKMLGIGCLNYLQSLRISQAKARLSLPGARRSRPGL